MKREELREAGLTDEQLNTVMAAHGKTVAELNGKISAAEQERNQFKEQLSTNQAELNALKESAKGNEALTKELADLQEKFNQSQKDSEAKLSEFQKSAAIELALTTAGAKNVKAATALLDLEALEVTENGVKGLDDQLEAIKKDNDYLFQDVKPDPTPRIVTPGNPKGAQTSTGSMGQQMKTEGFNLTQFLKDKGDKE